VKKLEKKLKDAEAAAKGKAPKKNVSKKGGAAKKAPSKRNIKVIKK